MELLKPLKYNLPFSGEYDYSAHEAKAFFFKLEHAQFFQGNCSWHFVQNAIRQGMDGISTRGSCEFRKMAYLYSGLLGVLSFEGLL